MGRGGYRPGAGRKPTPKPEVAAAKVPVSLERMLAAIAQSVENRQREIGWCPYAIDPAKQFPPGAVPKVGQMAQDADLMSTNEWAVNAWMAGKLLDNAASEGLLFLGYPYLSELAQRPEYRVMSETIATEMTRKWIRFKAASEDQDKTDKIKELTDFLDNLKVREKFGQCALYDGWFGRSHLYMDCGNITDLENSTPIAGPDGKLLRGKVGKRWLKDLKLIEPLWVYPTTYNATNPLEPNWYDPQTWYVMGKSIHRSRLLTFIGRPVPDILRPAYAFGGISLSQLAKPYVDIWLKTRASVAEIIRSFSVMVLKTDMVGQLQQAGTLGQDIGTRAALFNMYRDNQGLMIVDNATEDFSNVSAPISGLHELQAQSQEHMMCLPAGTLIATDSGNVPIELITLKDKVWTREGLRSIAWVGVTDKRDALIEIEVDGRSLGLTEEHPVWRESTNEFVNAESVCLSDSLLVLPERVSMALPSLGAEDGGGLLNRGIIETKRLVDCFIGESGKFTAGKFRRARKFITRMGTVLTTRLLTLRLSLGLSTPIGMGVVAGSDCGNTRGYAPNVGARSTRPTLERYIARQRAKHGQIGFLTGGCLLRSIVSAAYNVVSFFKRSGFGWRNSVLKDARAVRVTNVRRINVPLQQVYNIEVKDGPPEFFANGVLVHNSVARIPAVKFTGIQPSGLNASSDGEIRVFYDTINAFQPVLFGQNLNRVIDAAMVTLWGETDPEIVYEWVPLWSMSEKEEAEVREIDARSDITYADGGIIDPIEIRTRLANDPRSNYSGLDPADLPEPPVDPAMEEGGGFENDNELPLEEPKKSEEEEIDEEEDDLSDLDEVMEVLKK